MALVRFSLPQGENFRKRSAPQRIYTTWKLTGKNAVCLALLFTHLSSMRGAGSSMLNGCVGTLSRYTGWKKLRNRNKDETSSGKFPFESETRTSSEHTNVPLQINTKQALARCEPHKSRLPHPHPVTVQCDIVRYSLLTTCRKRFGCTHESVAQSKYFVHFKHASGPRHAASHDA